MFISSGLKQDRDWIFSKSERCVWICQWVFAYIPHCRRWWNFYQSLELRFLFALVVFESVGVISGAMLYIRDDFKVVDKNTWLQETIVSTAVAGAIIAAAGDGWLNDRFGRKISILAADFLFFIGAIIMAVSPTLWNLG